MSNKNNLITAKELINDPIQFDKIIKKAFINMDTNGNGEIDKNELRAALFNLSEKHVDDILREIDDDHSGTISFIEFKAHIKGIINELIDD